MRAFFHSFALAAFALLIMAPVTGCTTTGLGDPPPVTSGPVADELATAKKAIGTVAAAFDMALDAVEELRDAGVLVPGSPKGQQVAALIRKADKALVAAQNAVTMADYVAQLGIFGGAMKEVSQLIEGKVQ